MFLYLFIIVLLFKSLKITPSSAIAMNKVKICQIITLTNIFKLLIELSICNGWRRDIAEDE